MRAVGESSNDFVSGGERAEEGSDEGMINGGKLGRLTRMGSPGSRTAKGMLGSGGGGAGGSCSCS